jgi:TrpR family trp operon transcriptional repressor
MSKTDADFACLCTGAEKVGLLEEWLAFLFTPAERDAVLARLTLIDALLDPQLTQREMSKTLGISIAKITRGSNALKQISPQLKAFLIQSLRRS